MQTARRLYVYLISGIGIGMLVGGLTMLLSVLFDRLGLRGAIIAGEGDVIGQQLTLASALIVVGLPVWLIHWLAAERSVRPGREGAALERTSDVRGLYFALAMGILLLVAANGVSRLSPLETVIGYVGAAATKSIVLGLVILVTAAFFVPLEIRHPGWMATFMVLTALTFSLFGFIVGIWAKNWEQMQLVPMLIVTPLTFLGGAFYSIDMLPEPWRTITLFNPVVYLVSGMRWSFYGIADVNVGVSAAAIVGFLVACVFGVWWIFRTVYKLKA
jgi:hypothetical protein